MVYNISFKARILNSNCMKKRYWIVSIIVIILIILFFFIFYSTCNYVIKRWEWREISINETQCVPMQEHEPDRYKWENETCWQYIEIRIC